MKIKFLGSGSAFVLAEENYQSNIMISKEDKHLLFDAGSTIAESLNSAGLIPQDIDSIFISHLHDDHCGGIEYLAFKTYFEVFNFGKSEFGSMKPNLISSYDILSEGWENSWRGGLQSVQEKTNTLEDYFNCIYLNDNSFDFYGTEIDFVKTKHVKDDKRWVPSYGLFFMENDNVILITGDSQFDEDLYWYYEKADIIFQEVEFADYPNSVHTQYRQLLDLDSHTRSKMHLYHYSLGEKSYEEVEQIIMEDGFAGLVKRGDEFDI